MIQAEPESTKIRAIFAGIATPMNTPAHILIGGALFSKRHNTKLLIGAMMGGILPDVSLYVLAGVAIFLLNITPQVVFDELYFSDNWQLVFSIDNSFFVWALLLALAWRYKSTFYMALTCSALFHLITDFALHNDDARAHFWPLSDWRFLSPLSYWDSDHHAHFVGPMEGIVATVATIYLLTSQIKTGVKVCIVGLLFAEFFVLRSWLLYF